MLRRLSFITILVTYCLSMGIASAASVPGLTSAQRASLDNDSEYYQGQCTTTASDSTTIAPATGKSAWNSNAQPPYYLEELIINILQDLAQTLNVPQSDTVTQQHVIAMVAWAQAEGGNIANSNAFNIWNMGFLSQDPTLYAGGVGAADGSSDSFASFNAAVQAYAIEFTGSFQSRIGAILSKPDSTPEQIFHAIAYPQTVSGNEVWATADPASYVNSMDGGLSAARQNYDELASVVIGPGEESTHHVPASELQFSGGSGSSSGASTGNTISALGADTTCACSSGSTSTDEASASSSSASPSSGPTIVLDPGHATSANEDVDPATDEPVFDYSNPVEQQQVWTMALDLKTKLTAAGYNVLITKNSENDTNTNLKERAEVGNNANAALGVSLHTTPGSPTNGNDVFYPVVGEYLVKVNGQHDVYSNQSLSNTDKGDAQTMAQSLGQASGLTFKTGGYGQIYGPITRYPPDNSGVVMKGTMLVTQYFATVPWLYLERYQDGQPYYTTQKGMDDYETGVLNGIEKIVPISGASTATTAASDSSGCSGSSGSTNCLTATGDAKILCEAEQWNGIYYEYGGGHDVADYTAFAAKCPDPSKAPNNQPYGGPSIDGGRSGNPSPCAVDCSALVSFATDEAFGLDYTWTVSTDAIMVGDGSQYWKRIPIAQAQAGDIVTLNDATGHVEVVDHVSGDTVYTFGARATGTKDSEVSQPASSWTYAWHWTGTGSNGN